MKKCYILIQSSFPGSGVVQTSPSPVKKDEFNQALCRLTKEILTHDDEGIKSVSELY